MEDSNVYRLHCWTGCVLAWPGLAWPCLRWANLIDQMRTPRCRPGIEIGRP